MAATRTEYQDSGDRRTVVTVQFASGQPTSDVADLRGLRVDAIRLPAGWTAAALAASESADNAATKAFQPIDDDGGGSASLGSVPAEWRVAVTASRTCLVGSALDPFRYVQLRSVNASTGAAVNQGSTVSVDLVCSPVAP